MWPAAELAGSELGLEMELEQLEEGSRKTRSSMVTVCESENKEINGGQASPGGPPMVGKDMDPVICRACWAAGGIFRPVPGISQHSHLLDSQ